VRVDALLGRSTRAGRPSCTAPARYATRQSREQVNADAECVSERVLLFAHDIVQPEDGGDHLPLNGIGQTNADTVRLATQIISPCADEPRQDSELAVLWRKSRREISAMRERIAFTGRIIGTERP